MSDDDLLLPNTTDEKNERLESVVQDLVTHVVEQEEEKEEDGGGSERLDDGTQMSTIITHADTEEKQQLGTEGITSTTNDNVVMAVTEPSIEPPTTTTHDEPHSTELTTDTVTPTELSTSAASSDTTSSSTICILRIVSLDSITNVPVAALPIIEYQKTCGLAKQEFIIQAVGKRILTNCKLWMRGENLSTRGVQSAGAELIEWWDSIQENRPPRRHVVIDHSAMERQALVLRLPRHPAAASSTISSSSPSMDVTTTIAAPSGRKPIYVSPLESLRVNQIIRVYWPKDDAWYKAKIVSFELNNKTRLLYADGTMTLEDLSKEKFQSDADATTSPTPPLAAAISSSPTPPAATTPTRKRSLVPTEDAYIVEDCAQWTGTEATPSNSECAMELTETLQEYAALVVDNEAFLLHLQGWKLEKRRLSSGRHAGSVSFIFIDPAGLIYRSRREVFRSARTKASAPSPPPSKPIRTTSSSSTPSTATTAMKRPKQALDMIFKDTLWEQITVSDSILVVCGAGVSVSAGIPDFRSKNTGLYSKPLAVGNRKVSPEVLFDYETFVENPGLFYSFANERLFPCLDAAQPTSAHHFLAHLQARNKLLRVYTQNVDGLEMMAGVAPDKLVQCHGTMRAAVCTGCTYRTDVNNWWSSTDDVPECPKCSSPLKPDMVFFGQRLFAVADRTLRTDCKMADLCLVVGTTLSVAPLSSIIDILPKHVPVAWLNKLPYGVTEMNVHHQALLTKSSASMTVGADNPLTMKGPLTRRQREMVNAQNAFIAKAHTPKRMRFGRKPGVVAAATAASNTANESTLSTSNDEEQQDEEEESEDEYAPDANEFFFKFVELGDCCQVFERLERELMWSTQ